MSFPEIMSIVTGLLQFTVAGVALRLNRLFGTARVGWSLFWAFSLLALLHFIQSIASFNSGVAPGVEIEVIYSLISLLLLTGMVHIESLLKERRRVEETEKRLRDGLEFLVGEKTAHLTRTIGDLQSEIAERKRMEAEVERTHRELLAASRQAALAEIADRVLQNVSEVLRSVNASAALVSDRVKQSKIADAVRLSRLIREHAANLGDFMTRDPQGRQLPASIAQLADYVAQEQATLERELDFIRTNLERIKTVVAVEQNCAQLADETNLTQATALVETAILENTPNLAPEEDESAGKANPAAAEGRVEKAD